ncbi:unnamed protein product (macronuclear) [Paramecium tetraurelia]|uniref:Uncharacterized protein n=1 Tax=Paramecium tetraurelia TaxID=5888 RepID=A0C9Q0_PARTE|nr:uncharacterized protein GSPATT00006823001 [Paramecium tetraurelia]CAK67517.1 unnamed protein product [Paramecium tetraurelia]|eukprot:XP_001434914.1 hypothetical protein (macronuclear) [Paramecium tetraurelia strain d4-2]
MKSLNLQFGDNRQNQREDMFLANIVEKVQQGKIGLISFVDQAQFIDLMTQKHKKKAKVQPAFNKIFAAIQINLAKHQQSQQKIQEVSYEIKTISSTRQLGYRGSFNISNKSGALLLHKDSNLKEHQTNEFSDKEILDQQILDEATKTERSKRNLRLSQITSEKNEIKGVRTIQTSRDNTQDQFLKQDNLSTARNEKLNYNLLTQEQSDQSQSQIKMESQQSCLIPTEKLRYGLNTNFTSEISNGQVQNQSATFNNQQESNQQQPLTSRKQSDVLLKSIKGSYPQKAYLISQQENSSRKTLTPIQQTKLPPVLDPNQRHNETNQQTKSVSKAEKQQNVIKNQKATHRQQQSQQEFKQQKRIQHKPQQSLAAKQKPLLEQGKQQQQQQLLTQETSFCGNINNSQKPSRRDIDERQQESPQFLRTDLIEDMVITNSPQQSQPKDTRQTTHFKQDINALNISEHSFQSKKHTIDQYDINSLMPPQSSRTLTSAQKDKIDQRNHDSNNSETDQKQHKNQLTVTFKRGSKRMKSHNVQGNENEYDQQEDEKKRRYSQERLFKSDNRFEKLEEDRYQYTINNLEQSGSSSDLNNYENENNNNQINIQVSRCDNRENIIEEESLDGSMRQHQAILFSTQDRMHLKIGDNSYLPQSSSRSVAKSITPNTPVGSVYTAQHSTNGTVQNTQVQRKRKQANQHKRPQLSNEYSQTKISIQKQKSEDSYYEKEYTNESSQEPERSSRLKPKKLQQKLQPPLTQIQQQRRKSSTQVSPMDPRKAEQMEREKQKQLDYQKQIERMKLERELMEQYKIPEDMPLPQKKQIIESLIGELSHQHDQEIHYQVSLYNERQDQISNIQRNYEEKIDFRYNIVNSCYYEMDYLCDHKLKLKQKDQEAQKIIHLKFQDQNYNNQPKLNQNGDKEEEEEGSPFKKQSKLVCNFDPVEIENQLKRRGEFMNETELLKFLKQFQSEFDKKVYQCNLDHPIQDNRQDDKQFTRGLIARNFRRKQTKNITSKIEFNNYQMDMNKIQYVKEKATKIQKLGLYLLMNS